MTRIFDRNPIQGHRPKPWKPPLSTDVPVAEKSKCHGELERERAAREGRIGSDSIGTPGGGEAPYVESWYERHPDKLPGNPQTMTPQAMKLRPLDTVKAQGQRRRRERERAKAPTGRKVIDGTGGFNRRPASRRRTAPDNASLTMTRPPAVASKVDARPNPSRNTRAAPNAPASSPRAMRA
jgi:hypothetical protein